MRRVGDGNRKLRLSLTLCSILGVMWSDPTPAHSRRASIYRANDSETSNMVMATDDWPLAIAIVIEHRKFSDFLLFGGHLPP